MANRINRRKRKVPRTSAAIAKFLREKLGVRVEWELPSQYTNLLAYDRAQRKEASYTACPHKPLGLAINPPNGYVNYLRWYNDPPKPYRSWTEVRCKLAIPDALYEPEKMPYTYSEQRTYLPDLVLGDYLLEVKGRFSDTYEMKKYLHIREAYPDKEIIFIWDKEDTALPGARPRKDKTRRTNEEWAVDNGFRYCYSSNCAEWLKKNCIT